MSDEEIDFMRIGESSDTTPEEDKKLTTNILEAIQKVVGEELHFSVALLRPTSQGHDCVISSTVNPESTAIIFQDALENLNSLPGDITDDHCAIVDMAAKKTIEYAINVIKIPEEHTPALVTQILTSFLFEIAIAYPSLAAGTLSRTCSILAAKRAGKGGQEIIDNYDTMLKMIRQEREKQTKEAKKKMM